MNILGDPRCLDFIYINENQRGKGHGRRLMKLILNHFQVVIHALDSSLGFFEHISKDLGLQKINITLPFDSRFVSSNLDINRLPIVNTCLRGCGLKFSGYKRYACPECSTRFVIENTDKELIKLINSQRSRLKNEYQATVVTLITEDQCLETLNSNTDPNFKKSATTDAVWEANFYKNTIKVR